MATARGCLYSGEEPNTRPFTPVPEYVTTGTGDTERSALLILFQSGKNKRLPPGESPKPYNVPSLTAAPKPSRFPLTPAVPIIVLTVVDDLGIFINVVTLPSITFLNT